MLLFQVKQKQVIVINKKKNKLIFLGNKQNIKVNY